MEEQNKNPEKKENEVQTSQENTHRMRHLPEAMY